jgi:beta-lactamase superfamily II metal-dependent hydrolase
MGKSALTEGDARNIGGAQSLNELFGVGELVTGPVHFRSTAYRDIVEEFATPPSKHKIIQCGDMAGNWQALYPVATNNFPRADDNALVLLGNFHGGRIILLSDLGRDGQGALLEQKTDLHADIVIAGLPAQGGALCDALLEAIQPKVIVIADSELPANRRANHELKERLEQTKVPVIYTRASGAVKIITNRSGWSVETMDGQKFNSAALPGRLKYTAPAK